MGKSFHQLLDSNVYINQMYISYETTGKRQLYLPFNNRGTLHDLIKTFDNGDFGKLQTMDDFFTNIWGSDPRITESPGWE